MNGATIAGRWLGRFLVVVGYIIMAAITVVVVYPLSYAEEVLRWCAEFLDDDHESCKPQQGGRNSAH